MRVKQEVENVQLKSEWINSSTQLLPYRLTNDMHAALEDYLRSYSPMIGPVRKVVTYFPPAGGASYYVGHCEYYDVDYVLQRVIGLSSLDTGVQGQIVSGGKGYDMPGMYLSCLGEAVERELATLYYFAAIENRVRYGTYRELTREGSVCLAPAEMPMFTEDQFEDPDFLFERFTEDSFVGWVEGTRLISGETIWVPAQLVDLVYSRRPDEAMIGYAVSGGLTSHFSRELALFHGITELIERDAVNLHWHCRIPPKKIVFDVSPRSRALRKLLEECRTLPGEIDFYYHAIDFPEIPVITAVEVDPWLTRYSYYSGGGADLDIETSLVKALNEFGQAERTMRLAVVSPTRSFANTVTNLFDMDPDDPPSKIDVFFKVVGYYGYEQNKHKMEWYTRGGEETLLSALPSRPDLSPKEKFEFIQATMEAHDIDPIVFDLTPPPVRSAKLMKVFIPELTQPFIQSIPCFGHPRFQEARRLAGVSDEALAATDILRDPLPYP